MTIDIRNKDCCYVKINGYTFYINDSTDEQIVQVWKTSEGEK